ncbi:MAG TPA: hypothetical protein VE644_11815 [Gaiellaceae bacterium]|jgi:hypothetical protein|nr:hypothetical protein [Gaiellaceae bacterium]
MRLLRKLTSAHALALIALFVALGGTAGANGLELITGKDVKNRSLTGKDVKNGSLTGRDIKNHSLRGKKLRTGSVGARPLRRGSVGSGEVRNGTLRARDFDRTHLPGLTRATETAPDITDYTDFEPIVSTTTKRGGDFLVLVRFSVTNTGGADEFLNCGFQAGGILVPAAGAQTTAGGTTTTLSVTVVEVDSAEQIDFVCAGSGGTSYDISDIRLTVLTLALG